ncbi:MAG: hypothetical protein RLZZ15_1806, partial [Verrucomicrobiota bacterium]
MNILALLPLARRPATRLALGLCALLACAAAPARAQTTLATGDAVILSFDQATSTFKWAPLVDLAAGTVIGLTDYGYPGGSSTFSFPATGITSDGYLTVTFSAAVTKGTIFTVTITPHATAPSVSMTRDSDSTSFSSQVTIGGGSTRWSVTPSALSGGGDSLIIYQGNILSSPTFVFCAAWVATVVPNTSGGFTTSASTSNGLNASALPPGLTVGTNAFGWPTGAASGTYSGAYNGPTTATDRATWLSRIVGSGTSPSSWTLTAPASSAAVPSVSGTLAFTSPAPTVSAISPTSGTTAGGTSVTITGTNLTGATGVTIGGTAATLGANTGTTLAATTGAHAAGTGLSVLVTTPGGTNSANTLFTYVAPDTTPPTVTSIIRQTPSGQSTTSTSATFRVTFSEAVNAPTT